MAGTTGDIADGDEWLRKRPAGRPCARTPSRDPAVGEPRGEPVSGTGMIAALGKMASLHGGHHGRAPAPFEPEVPLATLIDRGSNPTEESVSEPSDGLTLPSSLKFFPREAPRGANTEERI